MAGLSAQTILDMRPLGPPLLPPVSWVPESLPQGFAYGNGSARLRLAVFFIYIKDLEPLFSGPWTQAP